MNNFIVKYCKKCNYYYYRKKLANNYKYTCYCGYSCINYNVADIIEYKLLNSSQYKIANLILDLYEFNRIFKLTNMDIDKFYLVIKNILNIIFKNCCNSHTDLLFIIAGALVLKNKRFKYNNILYMNFNNALFILSLDFYFSIIFISDFSFSLSEWKKLIFNINPIIKKRNCEYAQHMTCSHNKNKPLTDSDQNLNIYYLYINYLKKINYNIYIQDDIIFKHFEIIINK